jgi:hypothetical protein
VTLERQADEILAAALARAGTGAIDNAGVAAFTLGLDSSSTSRLARTMARSWRRSAMSRARDLLAARDTRAPETSKSASLPVHPGAQAYYEGEVESFFERYGDWLRIETHITRR